MLLVNKKLQQVKKNKKLIILINPTHMNIPITKKIFIFHFTGKRQIKKLTFPKRKAQCNASCLKALPLFLFLFTFLFFCWYIMKIAYILAFLAVVLTVVCMFFFFFSFFFLVDFNFISSWYLHFLWCTRYVIINKINKKYIQIFTLLN